MRRLTPVLLASSFSVLFLAGCADPEPGNEVWFVQATDPHLFYDTETEKREEHVRRRQEALNQEAFEDLIHRLGSLPGTRAKPSFLVITGDFGLDRFANAPPAQAVALPPPVTAAPPATPALGAQQEGTTEDTETTTAPASPDSSSDRASAIEYLVGELSKSPIKEIYLVPGNNDVDGEKPDGEPVQEMQSFWSDVQQGLMGTGVTLHDLTACYFEGGLPSSCSADVEGTPYRLIGFPSHSFKNKTLDNHIQVQVEQLKTLASLIDEAGRHGKEALILTHIPEVDDPHALASRAFGLLDRRNKAQDLPAWAETSPWNVGAEAFASWKRAVESPAVVAVLAGHFHDSHKEIYQRPYDWATRAAERADLRKLYLAPPLSVRFQDQSPIQARGFALFRLGEQGPPERTLFWFDWKQRTFEPERPRERPRGFKWPAVARAYWAVTEDATDLARAAVIAIAFLAAFLTIVQLWEVPPAKSPLAGSGAQNPSSASETTNGGGSPSALQGNFAKTVLAGLGGMLALSFLESIWSMEELNTTAYYIVLFVTFFFGFLLLYAVVQSLIEALRSRLVTQYPVRPLRHSVSPAKRSGLGPKGLSFGPKFSYWRGRIWHWLLSLRIFLLILFDTFFNVIRGRNQLQTAVFAKEIIDLHWSIVRAADRIREEVEAVLLEALNRPSTKQTKEAPQGEDAERDDEAPSDENADKASHVANAEEAQDEDIRVSVSVLSQDEETLFYVAREKGSLARGFDKRSVAWVSVYTGKARWWRKGYKPQVELLTNSGGGFPLLPEGKILLGQYYQERSGSDYEAFIVFPVPWSHRGGTDAGRRAGLQISFRKASYMRALFSAIEKDPAEPAHDLRQDLKANHVKAVSDAIEEHPAEPIYDSWQALLGAHTHGGPRVEDAQLRNVLLHSLGMLEELFAGFNETVFDLYIRPQIRPN